MNRPDEDTGECHEGARTSPGGLHGDAVEKRQRIAGELERVNGARLKLIDHRSKKLAQIERLQREVAEYEGALAECAARRDDLIAMDDAVAEEQRALERILVRRTGR